MPPPELFTIERKPWGHFERLYVDEQFELARIVVLPGGFCSKHRHAKKDNSFWVVSGRMRVIVFISVGDKETEISHELGPSDAPFNVGRGMKHRFESIGGAVAYESYRAVEGETIDVADIVRDEGHPSGRK